MPLIVSKSPLQFGGKNTALLAITRSDSAVLLYADT